MSSLDMQLAAAMVLRQELIAHYVNILKNALQSDFNTEQHAYSPEEFGHLAEQPGYYREQRVYPSERDGYPSEQVVYAHGHHGYTREQPGYLHEQRVYAQNLREYPSEQLALEQIRLTVEQRRYNRLYPVEPLMDRIPNYHPRDNPLQRSLQRPSLDSTTHRGGFGNVPRGGRRRHRHHLDDIYLPNYDDDSPTRDEERPSGRGVNWRNLSSNIVQLHHAKRATRGRASRWVPRSEIESPPNYRNASASKNKNLPEDDKKKVLVPLISNASSITSKEFSSSEISSPDDSKNFTIKVCREETIDIVYNESVVPEATKDNASTQNINNEEEKRSVSTNTTIDMDLESDCETVCLDEADHRVPLVCSKDDMSISFKMDNSNPNLIQVSLTDKHVLDTESVPIHKETEKSPVNGNWKEVLPPEYNYKMSQHAASSNIRRYKSCWNPKHSSKLSVERSPCTSDPRLASQNNKIPEKMLDLLTLSYKVEDSDRFQPKENPGPESPSQEESSELNEIGAVGYIPKKPRSKPAKLNLQKAHHRTHRPTPSSSTKKEIPEIIESKYFGSAREISEKSASVSNSAKHKDPRVKKPKASIQASKLNKLTASESGQVSNTNIPNVDVRHHGTMKRGSPKRDLPKKPDRRVKTPKLDNLTKDRTSNIHKPDVFQVPGKFPKDPRLMGKYRHANQNSETKRVCSGTDTTKTKGLPGVQSMKNKDLTEKVQRDNSEEISNIDPVLQRKEKQSFKQTDIPTRHDPVGMKLHNPLKDKLSLVQPKKNDIALISPKATKSSLVQEHPSNSEMGLAQRYRQGFNPKMACTKISQNNEKHKDLTRTNLKKADQDQNIPGITEIVQQTIIRSEKQVCLRNGNELLGGGHSIRKFCCHVIISRIESTVKNRSSSPNILDLIDTTKSYLPKNIVMKRRKIYDSDEEDDTKKLKNTDDVNESSMEENNNKHEIGIDAAEDEELQFLAQRVEETSNFSPIKKIGVENQISPDVWESPNIKTEVKLGNSSHIKQQFIEKYNIKKHNCTLPKCVKGKEEMTQQSDKANKTILDCNENIKQKENINRNIKETEQINKNIKKKLYDTKSDSCSGMFETGKYQLRLNKTDESPGEITDLSGETIAKKDKLIKDLKLTKLFGDDLSDLTYENTPKRKCSSDNSETIKKFKETNGSEQRNKTGIKRRRSITGEDDIPKKPKKIDRRRQTFDLSFFGDKNPTQDNVSPDINMNRPIELTSIGTDCGSRKVTETIELISEAVGASEITPVQELGQLEENSSEDILRILDSQNSICSQEMIISQEVTIRNSSVEESQESVITSNSICTSENIEHEVETTSEETVTSSQKERNETIENMLSVMNKSLTFFAVPDVLSDNISEVTNTLTFSRTIYHKAESKIVEEELFETVDLAQVAKPQIIEPYIDLTGETDNFNDFSNVIITKVNSNFSTQVQVKSEPEEEGELLIRVRIGEGLPDGTVIKKEDSFEVFGPDNVVKQEEVPKYVLKFAAVSELDEIFGEVAENRAEETFAKITASVSEVPNYCAKQTTMSCTTSSIPVNQKQVINNNKNKVQNAVHAPQRSYKSKPSTLQPLSALKSPTMQLDPTVDEIKQRYQTFNKDVLEILMGYIPVHQAYHKAYQVVYESLLQFGFHNNISYERNVFTTILRHRQSYYGRLLATAVQKLPTKLAYFDWSEFFKFIADSLQRVKLSIPVIDVLGYLLTFINQLEHEFPTEFKRHIEYVHNLLSKGQACGRPERPAQPVSSPQPVLTSQQISITIDQIKQYHQLTRNQSYNIPSMEQRPPQLINLGQQALNKSNLTATGAVSRPPPAYPNVPTQYAGNMNRNTATNILPPVVNASQQKAQKVSQRRGSKVKAGNISPSSYVQPQYNQTPSQSQAGLQAVNRVPNTLRNVRPGLLKKQSLSKEGNQNIAQRQEQMCSNSCCRPQQTNALLPPGLHVAAASPNIASKNQRLPFNKSILQYAVGSQATSTMPHPVAASAMPQAMAPSEMPVTMPTSAISQAMAPLAMPVPMTTSAMPVAMETSAIPQAMAPSAMPRAIIPSTAPQVMAPSATSVAAPQFTPTMHKQSDIIRPLTESSNKGVESARGSFVTQPLIPYTRSSDLGLSKNTSKISQPSYIGERMDESPILKIQNGVTSNVLLKRLLTSYSVSNHTQNQLQTQNVGSPVTEDAMSIKKTAKQAIESDIQPSVPKKLPTECVQPIEKTSDAESDPTTEDNKSGILSNFDPYSIDLTSPSVDIKGEELCGDDENEVIDLTWMDDFTEDELVRDSQPDDFLCVKVEYLDENPVPLSPAGDSGIESPPIQVFPEDNYEPGCHSVRVEEEDYPDFFSYLL